MIYDKHITFVLGDVHGRWDILNKFINDKQQKHKATNITIIACGDFGYWPRAKESRTKITTGIGHVQYEKWTPMHKALKLNVARTRILFCDGNHDDHWALRDLIHNEVMPGVFYMHRGAVATLQTGQTVLFMGGAMSIDRDQRNPNSGEFGWFNEEIISFSDLSELPTNDTKIDVMISHTCPHYIASEIMDKNVRREPSMSVIEQMLDVYQPKLLYFGHWHRFKDGVHKDTKWRALDMLAPGRSFWCTMLDDI